MVRFGEELLLTQGCRDLDEEFVRLGGGSVIHEGIFLLRDCFLRKDGMGSDVTEAKEQYGHQDRRNSDEQTTVENIASQQIEQGRYHGGDTDEDEQ